MYTPMVSELIPTIIYEDVRLFRLGPHPEPECDAAVASLVEMGFSEVQISSLFSSFILLFFFE